MEEQTYKEVYKELLEAQDLQPLTRFKSTRSAVMLYPDAQSFPDFFNNNLVAPGRVIKVAKGKSSLTRAFNYQLMKLTFQIEINQVDYVEVLKSVIFHPGLLQEDDEMQSPISGRGCTDRQYKRIIADFVELMCNQAIPNFEFTLMEYPIVDEALTYAVEALTSRCYSGEKDFSYSILNWLSQNFAMNVQKHGKCYKFQESDIFLYQQSQTEYYIAFLNQMAEVSDYSQSTHDKKSINDRLGINDRFSSNEQDHKGSHPDFSSPDEEDLDFRLITDKYRNSAQPESWKNKRADSPIVRRTLNSQVMKDIVVRQIDESIEKDKPSQQSKHEDTSKIGSLLDIMSEKSSKEHKNPQISSSRQFQEEDPNQPLTTRTDEGHPKIIISEKLKSVEEQKQLYGSNESDVLLTPQFPVNPPTQDQHYNPFTKKYSQQYMHLYEKGVPDYKANEYEFGLGQPGTKSPSFEQFKKSFVLDKNQGKNNYGLFGSDYSSSHHDYNSYQSEFASKPSYLFDSTPSNYSSNFNYCKVPSDYSHNQIEDISSKPYYGAKSDLSDYNPNLYLQNAAMRQKQFESNTFLKDSLDQLNLNKGYSFSKNHEENETLEDRAKSGSDTKSNHQDSLNNYKTPYEEFSLMKEQSQKYEYKPYSHKEDDEVFFRPEGKSKLTGSKASKFESEISGGLEDTKGTIYREFTDTRVLAVMTSFERVKTDAIRQKYRGMHKKDFFKRK